MSLARRSRRSASTTIEHISIDRGVGMIAGKRGGAVLEMPSDTRQRLIDFYREADRADAKRHASGEQKVRGSVWAASLQRLERGEEVYESFRIIESAGVEMPAETREVLGRLPNDWSQICRIDGTGVVRTASLKGRVRSGR